MSLRNEGKSIKLSGRGRKKKGSADGLRGADMGKRGVLEENWLKRPSRQHKGRRYSHLEGRKKRKKKKKDPRCAETKRAREAIGNEAWN